MTTTALRAQRAVQGPLTRREREVLTTFFECDGNDQVARKLGITSNTVHVHVYRIFRKLKVESRHRAILAALSSGLIVMPKPPDARRTP